MKLLVLSYYFPPTFKGGAEISLELLLKKLRGYNIDIFLITGKETDISNLDFKVYKLPIFWFPPKLHFIFEFFLPRLIAKNILKYIDPSKYDIVIANDVYSLLVASELKKLNKKTKFLYIVRDYLSICAYGSLLLKNGNICSGCNLKNLFINCYSHSKKSMFFQPLGLLFPWLVKIRSRALQTMDGLIFISKNIHDIYIKNLLVNVDKSEIIHNVILDIILEEKKEIKVKSPYKILYVGRMEDYKGVHLIIEIIPLVKKIYPFVKFYFIGEGRDKKKYISRVKRNNLKDVYFIGQLPFNEIKNFYEDASIVIIPSLWPEPLGRTLVESLSFGCITVASNYGFACELIKDGFNGFLFERGDPLSLFSKLKNIISNLDNLQYISENARKTVMEYFDADKIVKEYIEFFKNLLR